MKVVVPVLQRALIASSLSLLASLISVQSAVIPPLTLTDLSIANGNVTVRWQGGTELYQLQTRNSLTSSWQDVDAPTTNHSVTSVLIEPAASYRVRTVAKNQPAGKPPATTNNLTATVASCNQVDLLWDRVNGSASYSILRNSSPIATVTSTSYSDTTALPLTTYSYQVQALKNNGNSTGSPLGPVSVATPACTTPPTTPTNLVATPISCNRIDLTWSASTDRSGSGLRGYNVYRNSIFLRQVLAPATAVADTNVAPSTTYSYTVTAFDNAGNYSAMSSAASATTPSCCTYTVVPSQTSFGAAGGSASASVSTAAGCAWTASSGASWITITAGSSGSGNGTVTYTVAANDSCIARNGTLTIAGQNFTVTQAAGTGSFAISPTSAAFNAAGGSGSVSVTAAAGCAWTASSGASWITITAGSSGSGNGTVTYTVAANGSCIARNGTLTIGGQNFTVTQAAGTGSFAISPTSAAFNAAGGSGSVSVTAAAGCAWTASSGASWITITAGSSGSGNGTVTYTVAANGSCVARNGTLTIGGQNFTVTQAAGTGSFAISPTSASYASSGGNGSVSVTAAAGCAWTASSGASWITITAGSSGSGNGTVNYSVAANGSASSRTGTLTIAGQTFTVTQAGVSCTYAISPTSASYASSGGSGSVSVTAAAGCAWTASSGATWITITGGSSGNGNGTVNYSVAANGSASSRTGTLTVAGQVVTIDQSGASPKLAGFVPTVGICRRVRISGSVAYVASEEFGLTLVNVGDPSAPWVVSSVDVPFKGIYVAVSAQTACLTGQRSFYASPGVRVLVNGFYVADTSVTDSPRLLGSIEDNNLVFNGVAISGNYAYVACGMSGLKVIDLGDPGNPTIVGTYVTPGYAKSVTVAGNYAYVATSTDGLRIVNISNPANPVNVGWVDTPYNAQEVAVVGTMAYVADMNALQIVDVGNPTAPFIRGSLTGVTAIDVKVQNGVAYVAGAGSGLLTVDVSNPSSPRVLGSLGIGGMGGTGSSAGVAVAGSLVFVGNTDGGLAVLDTTNPSSPVLAGKVSDWFEGAYLATKPGVAVLTGKRWLSAMGTVNGLRVLNTDDPSKPYLLGGFDSWDIPFNGVAMAGNYAYVACGMSGLKVIDLGDPGNPTIVGTYVTPGYAKSVTVAGNYAYVATSTDGLRIVNISNPANPVNVGWVDTPYNAQEVAVVGTMAYVADMNALQIVDVGNPTAPFIRGSLTGVTAIDVKVQNGVAYVAGAGSGLLTVDVSNPSSPRVLGSLGIGGMGGTGSSAGVAVAGSLVFVGNTDGGLAIVDVASPSTPLLRDSLLTTGTARRVVADATWVCLGDGKAIINIVRR